MKKLFKSLFVVIAATATFAGCQKEENNAPATETKTVEFFANSIETKTHFGDKNDQNQYPVYWDAADKVKVLLNIEQVSGTENTPTVTPSDDFASARFVADITDPSTAETPVDSYTFYSVSPSSAYNGKSSKDGRITVKIPAEQTPLETSVDKAAQVLYAVSETTATMPSSVNLDYHHLTAYGKFSLTNLTSEVSTVSKIQIIAPEDVYMSGKWNYMVEDGSIVVHTEDRSNNIIINTSKTSDIWFACAPVDASGKDVKIVVTTDQGDLEKTVRFPKKFESGKVATFTINMDGIEPPAQDEPTYTLTKVTDASQFTEGQYVLISANESYYVPNSAATSSGPKVGTVTKVNSIISVSDDMLWNAVASGTGMLLQSAASASNYLVATSDGNSNIRVNTTSSCVWTATELSGYGVCLMSGKSTSRYLATYGSQDWRYYQSSNIPGSSKNNSPANLYKVTISGSEGDEPTDPTPDPAEPVQLTMTDITCSAQTENSLTFTWTPVTNASKYEVTINGITAEVSEATYTATGLTAATSYTISVKAVGDGVNYTTSAAKTQTGTTSAASTGGDTPSEPITVSKLISAISGEPNDGTKVSTMTLDNVIKATASSSGNNGKVYSSGAQWRLYQSDDGTITISATSGYLIQSVKFTYTSSSGGVLMKGTSKITSGTVDIVNASTVTYSVGNTGTVTNGQARITAIEVVYKAN